MPTAFIYCRLGEGGDADLNRQIVSLRRRFDAVYDPQDFAWRGCYIDHRHAGSLFWSSRPAARKLVAELAPGDVVLADFAWRIARGRRDWTTIQRVLAGFGTGLDVGGVRIDRSNEDVDVPGLAELGRHRHLDCLDGRDFWVGQPPLGWKVNHHGRLVADWKTRRAVEEVAALREREGMTFTQLFLRLFKERQRNRRRREWTRSSLHRSIAMLRRGWPLTPEQRRFACNVPIV